MKLLRPGSLSVLLFATLVWSADLPPDYARQRDQAERFYADAAFDKARTAYGAIQTNSLSPVERRWVQFRLADCRWRAHLNDLYGPEARAAEHDLVSLAPADAQERDRDSAWAEAQESLGDFHLRRGERGAATGDPYRRALDWWGNRTDIEPARTRYLGIVWRWTEPLLQNRGWVNWEGVSAEILDRVVRVASTPADQARAHLLRAVSHLQMDGPWQLQQVEADLKTAVELSAGTEWRDASLYRYAHWLSERGLFVSGEDGRWGREPDFERALEQYRRLLTEFAAGASPWLEAAREEVEAISEPRATAAVAGAFLPGSEVGVALSFRNVDSLKLSLWRIDLANDPAPTRRAGPDAWPQAMPTHGSPWREWTFSPPPARPHVEGNTNWVVPEMLPPGAYLLTVSHGAELARELVLVSDVALVVSSSPGKTLAWLVNGLDGQPIPNARLRAWRWRTLPGDKWEWRNLDATTDQDGLAEFAVAKDAGQLWIAAVAGDRQAWSSGWEAPEMPERETWKIYAVTDRPVYRPGDTIRWKWTARTLGARGLATPAHRQVWYTVSDARGQAATNGVAQLNDFGSAWGSLVVPADRPLGLWTVSFWQDAEKRRPVGHATLFRVEEYRLPEFEVTVSTPEEPGPDGAKKPKAYHLGETVEASVQARYYSGGPVVAGSVEVIVHQQPFGWSWPLPHPYPWYFEEDSGPGGNGFRGGVRRWAPDQIVRRETLRTDAEGRVAVRLDTDPNNGNVEYRFEVRVTDAAGREVAGQGTIRVTQTRYSVSARPLRPIARPGDSVTLEFHAKDAQDAPYPVTGEVRVTRDFWWEVWLDSLGREIQGEELRAWRKKSPVWPPKPEPGMLPWRLKFSGYRSDAVATNRVAIGQEGSGELRFQAPREGYYRFAWSSPDAWSIPGAPAVLTNRVTATASLWVTREGAADLGYRPAGVELIVDEQTPASGRPLEVMVVCPDPGRWVLLSLTGPGGAAGRRVLHLQGTAQLASWEMTDALLPNFALNAVTVYERQVWSDSKALAAPPDARFLTVEAAPGRAVQAPGETADWTLRVRDAKGAGVKAEVAFAVFDASALAIQPDLSGDPRRFFYPKRPIHPPNWTSSLNERPLMRLVRGRNGALRDDRTTEPDPERVEMAGREEAQDGRYGMPAAKGAMAGEPEAFGFGGGAVIGRQKAPTGLAAAAPMAAVSDAATVSLTRRAGAVPPEEAVVVRSDFRATAFWQANVLTDAEGVGRVSFKLPESLTRWQAVARAASQGAEFGWGQTNQTTRLPLMARLETPRFLVAGDEASIALLIQNQTDNAATVRPRLAATGLDLLDPADAATVSIPARGEARVDWKVRATATGEARLQATARGEGMTDATERRLPVVDHGLEQVVTRAGKSQAGDVVLRFSTPPFRPGSQTCVLTVTTSLASVLLEPLPYLARFPYGCVEQTMSRFLPALIARHTLDGLGLDGSAALARALAENEADPGPPGRGAPGELERLPLMIRSGLGRLRDQQRPDGAWGWWPGGQPDAWMTAYVVWGLELAGANGAPAEGPRLNDARRWLEQHLVDQQSDPTTAAWMLHALAARGFLGKPAAPTALAGKAVQRLWDQRGNLNPYTRALLILALQGFNQPEKARSLAATLADGASRDEHPDTSILLANEPAGAPPMVHWGDQKSWRWSDGAIETTTAVVRALVAVDPKDPLVEPAVRWLLRERRGDRWSNTRDSALTLIALNDYLRAGGEARNGVEFDVVVNGQPAGAGRFAPGERIPVPWRLAVPAQLLAPTNEIRLVRRGGDAPLYFGLSARGFSIEEPIRPLGDGLFVRRDYYRIRPALTLLNGPVEERSILKAGEPIQPGDRIECRLTLEAKNDTDYVQIEDLKPAGFEAVVTASGGGQFNARELSPAGVQSPPDALPRRGRPGEDFTGRERWVYSEWRDQKAACFLDHLPAGHWELAYTYRAETSGAFHGLPAVVRAMYAPELRGNSAETSVQIAGPR